MRNQKTSCDVTDLTSAPTGSYALSPAVTGMPFNGSQWLARVDNDGYTAAIFAFAGKTIYYRYGGTNWQPWVRLATTEPPQEYDLPMSNDLRAGSKYSKDQFDKVLVNVITSKSATSDDINNGIQIAQLPFGFRPSSHITIPCMCARGDNGISKDIANINLTPDGKMIVYSSNPAIRYIYASFSFLAS